MSPIAVVLAISLAANAALGWAYLGAHDAATLAEERQREASGDLKACSNATKRLRESGARQLAAGAQARASAAQAARTLQERAMQERQREQAVPGDACASAQKETGEWLEKRRAAP